MTTTALQARSLGPSLTVTDLQRSIQFYRDGLGFSVGQEWKEEDKLMGVMLEAGKAFVMLGQDDFAKGKDRTKGVGVRLYIETDQDVDALARAYASNSAPNRSREPSDCCVHHGACGAHRAVTGIL